MTVFKSASTVYSKNPVTSGESPRLPPATGVPPPEGIAGAGRLQISMTALMANVLTNVTTVWLAIPPARTLTTAVRAGRLTVPSDPGTDVRTSTRRNLPEKVPDGIKNPLAILRS